MNTGIECLPKETAPSHEAEKATNRPVYSPRSDVYETKDSYVVLADVPGADENNIEITVERNVLSIRTTVEFPAPDNHSLMYCEYSLGDYERRFSLPSEVDRENISASMKNGVLKLVLPKSSQSRMKKITVQPE
jgi:HSP20 family molecular chaperone IbpA